MAVGREPVLDGTKNSTALLPGGFDVLIRGFMRRRMA